MNKVTASYGFFILGKNILYFNLTKKNLGNFLLQRVFTKSSDNLFQILLKQLGALGSLKQAWINNKGGILARIAERAVKSSEEVQAHVMTHMTSAVCLSDQNIAKALLVETGKFPYIIFLVKYCRSVCFIRKHYQFFYTG